MNRSFPRTEAADRWLEDVLTERFGHTWHLSRFKEKLRLQLAGGEDAIVFDTLCDGFTEAGSDQPCAQWDALREGWVPVLSSPLPAPGFGKLPSPLIEKSGSDYVVHYDILGLTYWMLARVEEIGRADLDNHQRFPAASSHAHKHGYLERPIVDEWLHILGQVIQRQWPTLVLKVHHFSMKVSHDVDTPSLYAFTSWPTIGRMMAGHLFKRHDFEAFVTAPYVKLATRNQLHPADPFNTFDWMMEQSEKNGMISAFYFFCGRTDPSRDALYDPEMPQIRKLMREIHSRGHEIGLHPSYNTYNKPLEILREAERLRKVCAQEGIEQKEWGGRMHYLRWNQAVTLKAWSDAGMAYDSTLGYADRPGFRCGTCFEYPAFDTVEDKLLNMRIRPLIAMECTVVGDCYMGLGNGEAALSKITHLKALCRTVNGCFTLLWHNSQLDSLANRELYQHVLTT